MSYREHTKKGECLLNAILWSIIPLLQLIVIFYTGTYAHLDQNGNWLYILLLVMQTAVSAAHWYRYLAYDKKTQDNKRG